MFTLLTSRRRVSLRTFGLLLIPMALLACRSKAAKPTSPPPVAAQPTPPLTDREIEAIILFIKYEGCDPTDCDRPRCEKFSDGVTDGLPSRIVRCRWNDSRTKDNPKRCAYMHYSFDDKRAGIGNFHMSKQASSDDCESDPKFTENMKKTQGYTGAVP